LHSLSCATSKLIPSELPSSVPRQKLRELKIKSSFQDSEVREKRRGQVADRGPSEHITDFQSHQNRVKRLWKRKSHFLSSL
jgi:hypothetical protein